MPMYVGGHPARLYLGGSPLESLYLGGVEIYRDAWSAWTRVTGTGGATVTVPIPPWAAYMDVMSLGGGGGGATGDGGLNRAGNGGSPGQWATATVEVSRTNNTEGYVVLGRGGAGGDGSNGATGGATYWDFTGGVGRVAPASGGAGGSGTGGSPGGAVGAAPLVLGQSTGITGGSSAGTDTDGRDPGGGGGPGRGGIFGNYRPGRPGGSGAAWYRFRSWRP